MRHSSSALCKGLRRYNFARNCDEHQVNKVGLAQLHGVGLGGGHAPARSGGGGGQCQAMSLYVRRRTPAPIGYYFEPGLPCVLFVRVCPAGTGGIRDPAESCEKAELSKNSILM